jgi:hypothetical protein
MTLPIPQGASDMYVETVGLVTPGDGTGNFRLRGWRGETRTSMCRENIHLFDKSPEFD